MAGVWNVMWSLGKGERPAVPAEDRGEWAGGIGGFVAILFAAELLLGSGPWSQMVRVALLGGLTLSTVALACLLVVEQPEIAPG